MPKLWFINQFIVFSLYLDREIKKKLMLDYGRRKGISWDLNQMFDKIQMILLLKTSISNNRISQL